MCTPWPRGTKKRKNAGILRWYLQETTGIEETQNVKFSHTESNSSSLDKWRFLCYTKTSVMLRLPPNRLEPCLFTWKQFERTSDLWERECRTWPQKIQPLVLSQSASFLCYWKEDSKNLSVSVTTRWQITSRSDCVTLQARKSLWKSSFIPCIVQIQKNWLWQIIAVSHLPCT